MEKNSLLDVSNKPGPGPVFGTIIIIIVLVAGAIVVFSKQYQESKELQKLYKKETTSDNLSSIVNVSPTVIYSTSTDIIDIEKDLENSDLDNLEHVVDLIDTDIK